MTPHLNRAIYLALLAWQWVWHLALPMPSGNRSWIIAAVASIPLLLPLRGVVRLQGRAMIWAAYLVLLYLMVGIMETWTLADQRPAALVQTLLCSLFVAGVLVASRRPS